ncbi:hypothetical protein MC885_021212 [Smutsia gigantea]|nr:hypothetical protein MC885_021212 [Smutsia gigantea]
MIKIGSLSGTPTNSPDDVGDESRHPWVTAPVVPRDVVETAGGVCKFPGQQLSWWQAQEYCELQFGHLRPPDGVLAPRLPDTIWVGPREAPLRRPPQRRVLTTAKLVFGERTAHRAARLRTPPPALGVLTACAHVQWDPAAPDPAALFSLPAPALANALQLRAFAETGGAVHAALVSDEPAKKTLAEPECGPWGSPPDSQSSSKCLLCLQLVPDPLSEAHGHLSLAEAPSFLGILERVLVKEAAPLGPAALLAVMHFLRRVTALAAGEAEPQTGPWEQLGQGVVSVASLPGRSGVTMMHSWLSSGVFQHTLQEPVLEPQALAARERQAVCRGDMTPAIHDVFPHRFLHTQVASAIISSEVWDITGEVNTAVTFHLQHQAQVLSGASGKQTTLESTWELSRRGPEEESLLRMLSFVGCGVSFCALTTTFLLFLAAG